MKGNIRLLLVFFLLSSLMSGCKSTEVDLIEIQEEIEEEIDQEEEIPTSVDALDIVLKTIRSEVRVFDVVEHHDELQFIIGQKMIGEEMEKLEEIVGEVVRNHMDVFLKNRIEALIEEHNAFYSKSDIQWVFDRISTKDLYRLMTLYEKTYYEKKMGW